MSRSIGDTMVKGIGTLVALGFQGMDSSKASRGVVATPDVKLVDLTASKQAFMILAAWT